MAATMSANSIPIAGLSIALVTGVILVLAGIDILVVIAVVLVWAGTFWLATPPPQEPAKPPVEGLQISHSGMRDLIEHSGLPILLLDSNRIIVSNKAAREAFGSHIVGQDARVALRHPVAVDLLSRNEGGIATVQGLTGPRSSWQLSVQPIDERYRMIELINRTTEADVSRAHTDFVANASHELRTPLASIIGYMETLADGGEEVPPKQAAKFHNTVLREAQRLQSLVEDLMSLSRVEAEKRDQPQEKVDFTRLVHQAARDGAGPDLLDRLNLDLPSAPTMIRGDHRQLEQLVRNLVDNAFKYGSPEEKVTVALRIGKRNMAELTVTDRGEGIAAEHIPHLTRRFYRTDPSRSRAAGGTGLGLAIVKHIVERHRGRMDISSQLGVGTTVSVRIPVISE
jgi:two-component system phosphate regulon sensor histidine kinase PhoR